MLFFSLILFEHYLTGAQTLILSLFILASVVTTIAVAVLTFYRTIGKGYYGYLYDVAY